MNVIPMPLIIPRIANAMIGKSPLPNFFRPKLQSELARVSALDQLKNTLQGHISKSPVSRKLSRRRRSGTVKQLGDQLGRFVFGE